MSCKHYNERFPEDHPHNMAATALAVAEETQRRTAEMHMMLTHMYSAAQSGHSGMPARSGAGRFDSKEAKPPLDEHCPNGGCEALP